MLHSVAEAGRGGENARISRKSLGISSLACPEMWVKMRALPWAIALRRVAAEVIATILPSHGQSPDLVASGSVVCLRF